MQWRNRFGVAAAAIVAMVGLPVTHAGPLDPPAGPVAATGPTMIFSLPYTISSPGLYKFGRSLTAQGPFTGISINASNVSIDMAGHAIDGVSAVNSSFAFVCGPGVGNVTIFDGLVSNWRGVIACDGAARLTRLRVQGCGNAASLPYALVTGGSGSRLVECEFIGNVMSDAILGAGSTVLRYSSRSQSEGTTLNVGDRSVVTDCAIEQGSISTGKGSLVSRCSVSPNFGPGSCAALTAIFVGDGSFVSDSVVTGDLLGWGIRAATNCTVVNCVVSGPVSSNCAPFQFGIGADQGSTIRDCKVTVSGTESRGIGAPPGGEVRGCTVKAGASGIVATGDGATIDTNTITGTQTAILLGGTGNRVARNSIRGAITAISQGVGNDIGPTGTAATATSPWANLVN